MPKSKLIETAADLVYRQGWNATGINQILGEAKVPKGSFYYYFHSKEELGVAIVKFHAERQAEVFRQTFLNEEMNGRESIEKYFTTELDLFKTDGLKFGCPVGTFSNEVADTIEKIAAACRECFQAFQKAIEQAITRGQKDGSVAASKPANELSMQIQALWQGSLLSMKTMKSELPLQVGYQLIRAILF
jgi:TetR/AcrR family transcriptional repressor of nem operon